MTEPARDREPGTSDTEDARVVIRDKRKLRADGAGSAEPATPTAADQRTAQPAQASEDARLLAERTADLQRLQAEFANYRRRADRDRLAAGDLAVGGLLAALLPVLDDIDRARAHGDLTGGLKSVADSLETVLTKFGLQRFGDVGDRFDPMIHEAVTHEVNDDVGYPTATMILRPGYRMGERLLRPAMVGVTEPATVAAAVPDGEPDEAPTEPAGSEIPPDLPEEPTSDADTEDEPDLGERTTRGE